MTSTTFLFAGVPFLLAACGTWLLVHFANKVGMMDTPNHRSLHEVPTARTGGLAICLAVFAGFGMLLLREDSSPLTWIFGCSASIALISFLDDKFSLSAAPRMLAHLLTAGTFLWGFEVPTELLLPGATWHWPPLVATIFSVLFIAWLINLYNFMDGMDGFSGGMTVVGFGTFAVIGLSADSPLFSLASTVVALSGLGFLFFNFPPARIFMGDVGASTLGFLVATFAIWANQESICPLWVSVLLFSPFIADATVTLFTRAVKGERIWEAHRSHHYQRLVLSGWSHRRTVLLEYVFMAAAAGSSFLATRTESYQWLLAVGSVAIYGLFFSWVRFTSEQTS